MASFLIRQRADIQDCIKFIDALLKGAGPDAISAILGQRQHGKKWDGLVQLAESLNIGVPDIALKMEKARKKFQAKFQDQTKTMERDLPIEHLQLQDGFLKNADETTCTQIPKVMPNSSGVVIARYEDAAPWLENGSIISQDELSLIVIGRCLHDGDECQRIRVPVTLNGEPLVVSGCLHHLGMKKAIVSGDDDHQFPVNETQVLAVTAFKDEIQEATWNAILKAPVKHMMQILSEDAGDVELLAPPWGRSFQRNGKRCDVEVSTSVQIHIRIAKAELRRILKASGTGGIYCTPKTEDRRIASDYMIMWLNQSQVEFAVSLSKVDAHCGIIRSSKGDVKNKGIRFEKADFQRAFAILRPDDKVPQVVLANHHFKVAPTPLGTTFDQLQEWLTAQGWEARPAKPLSGDCWLCIAEKRFDTVFAQWNGNPILIRWVDDKRDSLPVILAGNVQRKTLRDAPVQKTVHEPSHMSQPLDDPWGKWIANKGGTTFSLANALAKSSPSGPPARKLESPIEDRFARHDSALQDLRLHTDNELEGIKEVIGRIEKNLEVQNVSIQSNMEQTNADFKNLRTETSNQLQALTNAFAESLKSTISAQDQQMSSQFAELKDMILSNAVSKSSASPPQKKPKKTDDAEL